jgi:hypothetical protein
VICFDVVMPLVHEHDPLGIVTVSPSEAELIAELTASLEQLAALMVAASERAAPPKIPAVATAVTQAIARDCNPKVMILSLNRPAATPILRCYGLGCSGSGTVIQAHLCNSRAGGILRKVDCV